MDGKVVIGVGLDTKSFEKEIASLERKLNDIESTLEMAGEDKNLFSTTEIVEMEKETEKLRNKLIGLYKQQNELGKTHAFENMGKGLSNTIKKTSRLVVAIFGIRTAYSAVRSAMSTISQYDDEMATRIEYIRYLLAYSIKPLIEGIVNLVYKLLGYINYIANAWFGKPLFDTQNADAFNKKLGSANKQAKELNKNLLGFDKINKLDSSSSSSGGGGAGGSNIELPQGQVPEWIRWIGDNKDGIIAGLIGIAGGLTAIKLGATALQGLGIGVALTGLVGLIQSLPRYIDLLDSSLIDSGTTWEQFGDILDDVSLMILGVGIATGNLPLVIIGATGLIVSTVMKSWSETKAILQTAENWVWEQLDKLEEKFGLFGTVAKGIFGSARDFIVDAFKGIFKPIKNVIDGILLILKGDLQGGILTISKGIANHFISALNKIIDAVNLFITPFRSIIVGVGKIIGKNWTMDNIKIPRANYLARGGIIVNRPGQGVPVGSAYAGEVSREGVLPLTNEASMSQLGYEIGKHVTVNADVTLELERRVLARVMKEIQGDNSFARNGG